MRITRLQVLIARSGHDVLGRRIAKRVYAKPQGGTLGYVRMSYVGDAVAFDTDSGGVMKLQYTWGNDVDDLIGVRDSAAGVDSKWCRISSTASASW